MKIRTDIKRQAILVVATRLFREVGYERASMSELAARCGGSKSTLYGYFASKRVLFEAVVRACATGHLEETIAQLDAEPGAEANLSASLQRCAEHVLAARANDVAAIQLYRMVVAEAGQSDVGEIFLDSGSRQLHAALSRLFLRAMKRGALRSGNAKVLAVQFTALVVAETNERTLARTPKPLGAVQIRKLASRAVGLFLDGACH